MLRTKIILALMWWVPGSNITPKIVYRERIAWFTSVLPSELLDSH